MPQWAPVSSASAAPAEGRPPSLSGGLPQWAPTPGQEAEVASNVRYDGQGTDQEKEQGAAEKAGKPAASEVRVSDWLAAAAGAGSGEVRLWG